MDAITKPRPGKGRSLNALLGLYLLAAVIAGLEQLFPPPSR
jgi:hypothetical protein